MKLNSKTLVKLVRSTTKRYNIINTKNSFLKKENKKLYFFLIQFKDHKWPFLKKNR